MYKLQKFTNAEMLRSLELLSEKVIKLTPANRVFFIKLYNYTRDNGIYDEDKKKYYIQLSSLELANILEFAHTTTCISLNILNKCGAIERIRCNGFKKRSNKEYNVNKPYLTYINSDFLKSNIIGEKI